MIKRTTLAADDEDLATLEHEARRRRISLAQLLREVVQREAAAVRAQRPPRLGILSSAQEEIPLSRLSVDDEEAPAATPHRS